MLSMLQPDASSLLNLSGMLSLNHLLLSHATQAVMDVHPLLDIHWRKVGLTQQYKSELNIAKTAEKNKLNYTIQFYIAAMQLCL